MSPANTSYSGQGAPLSPWQQSLREINRTIITVKEIAIILSNEADFDVVMASIALSTALQKLGWLVHIISPTPLNNQSVLSSLKTQGEQKDIEMINQIVDFLPQKQLKITVNYNQGSFSEVELKKTGQNPTLTLLPQKGEGSIEPTSISAQNHENQIGAAFLLEIENLSQLQQFYENNQTFFTQVPLINIDYHPNNSKYGRVNLLDSKASSICQIVTLMLYDLKFTLDENIARYLYAGMQFKTNNFSQDFFSGNLLEAASICLKYQKKK